MNHTNKCTIQELKVRDETRIEIEALLRAVRDGAVWQGLPRETSVAFFPIAARMSTAIQALLRRSIFHLYFDSVHAYRNADAAYAVLIYSLSRVFTGKPRTDFSYDVLDPKTIPSVCRFLVSATTQALALIEKQLMEAGELRLAVLYGPFRARRVIERVQKERRWLKELLKADDIVVAAAVQLLVSAGNLRIEGDIRKAALLFSQVLHRKLRKYFDGRDFAVLAPELVATMIRSVQESLSRSPEPVQAEALPALLDQAA